MWLIVGLGNPGREYEDTRHNVGFDALDAIAAAAKADAFRDKFSAVYARGRIDGEDVVLLKPQTYMNLSGQSVQPAAAFFKVAPENVIALHDELDLPFADVRLKKGGGHAGHNGLRDIIARMGPEFVRVRLGIGKPPPGFKGDTADYVLGRFDAVERAMLPDVVKKAVQMVTDVITLGTTPAMNRHHAKPKAPPKAPKAP